MRFPHILMFMMIVLGAIAGSTLATITYLNGRQSALNAQKVFLQSWENNSFPKDLNLQKPGNYQHHKTTLLPNNSLSSKVDFSQFRQSFLSAVKRRDETFIRALVTPQTQSISAQSLSLETYDLEDKNSPFWQQIEKAVTAGCTLEVTTRITQQETENEIWVCPKTFGKPIYDSDWQTQVAIIADRVNIRTKPKTNSPIIGVVSKELVQFDSETYQNLSESDRELVNQYDGWTPVILKNGKKGWVQNQFVYYEPRDYRISFARFDGQWRLRYLLGGNDN
ncbi:SH3 domain-containing protein [Floridanema aerugineum]|uniref:SH3 domain-containing protein n=1 Tax=Floridaenema aerugineum BLCC-F46 TaxID=3153654 RepID=A0ABV4X7Y8_9CYAN